MIKRRVEIQRDLRTEPTTLVNDEAQRQKLKRTIKGQTHSIIQRLNENPDKIRQVIETIPMDTRIK
ncbi:MAG: hypothetical protein EAX87_06900 [Candidatus Thorarchaeota archaeon]|nr:hypothetical protein [Candidatus Thorarchaeota archaeon]